MRASLSLLLLGSLLSHSLWVQASGAWGCRTKPGGGWDCSWSGQGAAPKPKYKPRRKPRPAPEPVRQAEPAPAPEPTPVAEPQSVVTEIVDTSPAPATVEPQVQPEPDVTGIHPYGQSLPPAESAVQALPAQTEQQSAAPAAESGGALSTLKRWMGFSDKEPVKPVEDVQPLPSQQPVAPGYSDPAPAPASPAVGAVTEPAVPAATDQPDKPGWFGSGMNTMKRWAGMDGTDRAEPRQIAPQEPAGQSGLDDLQPRISRRPEAKRLPEPVAEVKPDKPQSGFAPLSTLKRWAGMEREDQIDAPAASPAPVIENPPSRPTAAVAPQRPKTAPARRRPVVKRKPVRRPPPVPSVSESGALKIHSIQIVSASQRAGLENLIGKYGLGRNAWIHREIRNGSPWYSLLYGRYATLLQALDALPGLPEATKKHAPWVRKVEISR